jgi:UDP-3-O-[3-hydroxymyristoyl] glucosamine N-acyltransferase
MKVKDLAAQLGAPHEGDGSLDVTRVAPLDEAGPTDLSFAQGRALKIAAKSQAGCIIATQKIPNHTTILAPDPRAAVARAIAILHPNPAPPAGVHGTAVVDPTASIAPSASIGPFASIGANVRIGERTVLHAHVTIYRDVSIGDDCVLHAGCVIGADGFGFVLHNGAYEKFPQVGRVEIGNRVEIGANCCIDRAALGVTSIGDGTKLDNMVHVGHNCKIGRHVVVAAQTGFSGGVTIGDYAVIGGQVGVGDKARIESRAVLGSGSGVLTSKIVRAGEVMWGVPARPLKEHLKQLAALSKLAKRTR